jgi:hypothetical protein
MGSTFEDAGGTDELCPDETSEAHAKLAQARECLFTIAPLLGKKKITGSEFQCSQPRGA